MPHFIKTGFWEKQALSYNGWLNLEALITSVISKTPSPGTAGSSALGFPSIQRKALVVEDVSLEAILMEIDYFKFYTNTLSFPNLLDVTENIVLNLEKATSISFPKLETVGINQTGNNTNSIYIRTGGVSPVIDLSKLISTESNFYISADVELLNLQSYTTCKGNFTLYSSAITSLNLLNLTTVSQDLSIFNNDSSTLTALSFPSLTTVNGNIYIQGCAGLTDVSFSALTTFTGSEIYITACALSEATVNGLLAKFVEIGLSNVSIYLNEGTSAAPSGQGLVDMATLAANGCVIATN